MVVDRKKPEGTSSATLASEPLPNAANSSDVPTDFAAELKKEKVLEDKFQFVT